MMGPQGIKPSEINQTSNLIGSAWSSILYEGNRRVDSRHNHRIHNRSRHKPG